MNPWFWILAATLSGFVGTTLSIVACMIVQNPLPLLGWMGLWIIPAWLSERDSQRRNRPRPYEVAWRGVKD